MKNRINSRLSLAAINRSLAAVGESVDRNSFVRPVAAPVVMSDEVAAINRSLAVHGESVSDDAFFQPEGDALSIGNSVHAHLAGHDRFADVNGLGDEAANMVRAIERSLAVHGVDGVVFFEGEADLDLSDLIEVGLGGIDELRFDAYVAPEPVIFGVSEDDRFDFGGYDPRVIPLVAKLFGHDRFDDLRGLGEGCVDMVRAAIDANQDAFRFSSDGGFDDLGDDERDACNRALAAVGEEI